ncbi:MAG: hypothetical protein P4L39_00190 [Humidesulfovibrio sp.]|nr:hypothetical protein [Humidesulfovibrio sp.]
MLRLLPQPTPAPLNKTASDLKKGVATVPSALVYTLLRHGRGMTHQEAEHTLRKSLDGPFQAA